MSQPLPAAVVERLLADCQITGMTAEITVDPASHPAGASDPLVIHLTVAPASFRLAMGYDLPEEISFSEPYCLTVPRQAVLSLEARPYRLPGFQQPVTVSWGPAPREGTAQDAGGDVLRQVLEALCVKAGVSLTSDCGEGPARNYELAARLGIGHVFGLPDEDSSRKPERNATPERKMAQPWQG